MMAPGGAMQVPDPHRSALAGVRTAIDAIDTLQLALLGVRGRPAGPGRHHAGRPGSGPARGGRVHGRARRLAGCFGLAPDTAAAALAVAVAEARRRQGLEADLDQGPPGAGGAIIASAMHTTTDTGPAVAGARRALRLLPPPRRLAPLLHLIPVHRQRRLLESAMARVLASSLHGGELDFMRGRRLGIEVRDLGLSWVVELRDDVLAVVDGPAEASVRGDATGLLLLASRLEDADTLFFQRRLELTGDTELGLTVRNLLERLPWESVPLGLRIALNRGARLARAARAAHRGQRTPSHC